MVFAGVVKIELTGMALQKKYGMKLTCLITSTKTTLHGWEICDLHRQIKEL